MQSIWHALTRRKRNNESDSTAGESKLARVLTLFDLTALGIGSTLGLGVYVLAGSVAHDQAGPAVVLSFLVAAIASSFAGLCYAEFASRVPKAGSAYVYSYVSIGEFVAFTIGWNLILEYVIGTSGVARGLTGYIDALMDNKMEKFMKQIAPIDVDFLAEYPDFLSFTVIMILAVICAIGVKESARFNNLLTAVNLLTVCIVIVAGAINSDPKNWKIPKEDIPPNVNGGEGGFMPFGIAGVMAGAAKCFFGFVGFDCVATTGEEAKRPERNIPLSIVISLIIIFLSYFGVSVVLTMMWPYYLQNTAAPFPYVFEQIGWIEIKWIVTIGAIFALTTSMFGGMFPLPRVIYAMANDGILFKFLGKVSPRTHTPAVATILSGLLAAIMALVFNLHQLIDMMSIGTLLAYTIVSVCVLVLRYKHEPFSEELEITNHQIAYQILNFHKIKYPNSLSSCIAAVSTIMFSLISVLCCILMMFSDTLIGQIGLGICGATLLLILLILSRQPEADDVLTFKVPLVPLVPCLSIFINLYLMFQLDLNTWIRFFVWIAIGYLIYFAYGIKHSTQGALESKERDIDNHHISAHDDFQMTNHISFATQSISPTRPNYAVANGGYIPDGHESHS